MLGGIVRGKIATLRPPGEGDLAAVNAWMADLRVRRGGHLWDEPATFETWKERLKEAAKAERTFLWTIDVEGRPAGVVMFEVGREVPLGAYVRFFVVDADRWRRGVGWDAALAVHRYFFDYLDMHHTGVTLPADNAAGLRIAERLGYRTFGHGHDVYYRDGAYVDQLEMRYDREVWDERFGATEREYASFPEGIDR